MSEEKPNDNPTPSSEDSPTDSGAAPEKPLDGSASARPASTNPSSGRQNGEGADADPSAPGEGAAGEGPDTAAASTRGRRFRVSLVYIALIVLLLLAISRAFDDAGKEASYDEFLLHLRAGHVEQVETSNSVHRGIMNIPKDFKAPAPVIGSGDTGNGDVRNGDIRIGDPNGGDSVRQEPGGEAVKADGAGSGDGESADVSAEKIARLRKSFERSKIGGKLPVGVPFRFHVVAVRDGSHDLTAELNEAHEKFGTKFQEKESNEFWSLALFILAPFVLLAAIWFFMLRQSGQMGRTALSFGKVKAKLYGDRQEEVTFADVAGCDEAKEELNEVVDFLRHPKRYQSLGGRMPRGVLLVGPPGTGKTLLARAVAGEAKTPFFHLSGSDFVEMFVGVGAARVRDLFQQAKSRAPSIVFVDELDAVGRHRGAGLGGGHDEREQTLNQLLVEMDGFDATSGVIMLAATNRPDVLDPALLRPGRFDRQVVIDAPDSKGRRAILEVHARDKPFDNTIDFDDIAAKTPGFTGADLANVLNEAALLAARARAEKIGREHLDEAVERIIAGPERRSRRLNDEERERVAYHEAGHALVAALSKHADPVRKISIVPRGHAALGYTMQSPEEDRYLITEKRPRRSPQGPPWGARC